MNERMKMWLEGELKEYETTLREYKRKVNKMAWAAAALCVAAMMLLGVYVTLSAGKSIVSIFYMHLPVGCVCGLFVWFCFWCQSKGASMKKARAVFERDFTEFFRTQEEQEAFLHQMESGDYGTITYMDIQNMLYDKYPEQFVAGADYLMLLGGSYCSFVRVSDIKNIRVKTEKTKAHANMDGSLVTVKAVTGYSLIVEYKEEALARLGLAKDYCMWIYLRKDKQIEETVSLIKKHCPASREFMGTL
ncbi:MAG: hypothetical protein NC321_16675 [Clostridium sp.]|nr:hypothetical protein [Clostridium sp.]